MKETSCQENVINTCLNNAYVHKSPMTCDFQQCGVLTSVDSEEPVQLPFQIYITRVSYKIRPKILVVEF